MGKNRPFLAALLIDTLDDFNRSIENITSSEAEKRLPGFSSISWIVAHVAQHLDSWIIGFLAGKPRNEFLANIEFGIGGSGASVEWATISRVFSETLARSRDYLETVNGAYLDRGSIYEGSMKSMRGKSITGNYRLARLAAHLYYHIGEITTIRTAMGNTVADFPGVLPTILNTKNID
jgi:hypothetical protein